MKSLTTKILTVITIGIIVFGCKKNDDKGKFVLKLVNLNGTTFKNREEVIFNFEINHPITENINDKLFIRRKFITCPDSNGLDSINVPEYISTANLVANYELKFAYGDNSSYAVQCNAGGRTDSLYYTFWLKDKNGLLTDSVTSPKIILKK